MKEYFDTLMKPQLQEMSGSVKEWKFEELRKFALTDKIDKVNFESVTPEQLTSLSSNKPIKLQKINCYLSHLTKIELFFTNELESAAYETTSYGSDDKKSELTWDVSRQIKKISIKFYNTTNVTGLKFLDE